MLSVLTNVSNLNCSNDFSRRLGRAGRWNEEGSVVVEAIAGAVAVVVVVEVAVVSVVVVMLVVVVVTT